MAEGAYRGYLKHKVDQLWKEVEDLKAKVAKLEAEKASKPLPIHKGGAKLAPAGVPLIPVKIEEGKVVPPTLAAPPVVDDPVMEILKQNGPMNIVDINAALRASGVDETVRDTLFNRVKVLMKKEVVEYDEGTQRFSAR